MRISDWSSDVCSSDLGNLLEITAFTSRIPLPTPSPGAEPRLAQRTRDASHLRHTFRLRPSRPGVRHGSQQRRPHGIKPAAGHCRLRAPDKFRDGPAADTGKRAQRRSEEHTSELQYLMTNSYAVFFFKKHK